MDEALKKAIFKAVEKEPYAKALGLSLVELDTGYSLVEMPYEPQQMNNIYDRLHGGAVFSLIDEAFETVSQTRGTINVALNVNVTYVSSPEPGAVLRAEARQISGTRKTSTYDIRVTANGDSVIATCQALAFNTGKPIPFISSTQKGETA